MQLSIVLPLVLGFCFSTALCALDLSMTNNSKKSSVWEYIPPQHSRSTDLFDEVKVKSDQCGETFSTIASFLEHMKDSYHQFYFRYPLQNAEHAKIFAKVMQIKAQEANRFVPVIAECQFIEPRNLGFSRRIAIVDGPIVQEHVLIDPASDSVIFIEEFAITPDGKEQPGAFAALNMIIEDGGSWYFSGVYLYDDQPTDEQGLTREAMFKSTYENMIDFIKNHDVDEAHNNLKSF